MVGVDIVKIRRIEEIIDRWGESFLDRVFSSREREYCDHQNNKNQCYAVRFAAKESFYKAHNHPYGWKAIEVIYGGKPSIQILDERLKKEMRGYGIYLSLSHAEDIGIAISLITHA